jgi:DNA-binding beta-propeller fold protein YncE
MSKRKVLLVSGWVIAIVALAVGQRALESQQPTVEAPMFEVDPFWPKPLPNKWVLGNAIGVGVDSRDHVFIVHRQDTMNDAENGAGVNPPTSECCKGAPPVLEFDPQGNLVNSWGGPGEGYVWPGSNHGISIDKNDNVWIGGNGTNDSHILKFSHDGKFIAQFGKPNAVPLPAEQVKANYTVGNSNSMEHFGRVAKISIDNAANEAFVADGYLNKRVAVIDMTTGKIKRIWGAYGNVPSDTNYGAYSPDSAVIPQFRTPTHCAEPSNDGFVYVCDRPNDRIQVFQKDGKYVKEVRVFPKTLGDGSVWDIAFSKDPAQKYMYLADGKNEKIYVMDRQSLEILTMFGEGGRQPGQWFAVHSIATDSRGNIYTTETYEGKRLQKFVYKGMGRVPKVQGVVWPKK